MYYIKCSDLAMDCDLELKGENSDDVVKKMEKHLLCEHSMQKVSTQMIALIHQAVFEIPLGPTLFPNSEDEEERDEDDYFF